MLKEVWRAIPGWPGYAVSDQGHVRGIKGWVLSPNVLKGKGYLSIKFGRQGPRRLIHQLVLEAFVGPRPSPNHEGDHDDKDRSNNALSNLSWLTRKENLAQRTFRVGEAQPRHKLSNDLVRLIRAGRGTIQERADQAGVSYCTAWMAINHVTWKHVR
jgi:HNH endonuclease/NUMOD4 motif